MRQLIILGLSLCVVGTAAAQTEVIIRRPGEQDQVIRLDSAQTRAELAKTRTALQRATTAIEQRAEEMSRKVALQSEMLQKQMHDGLMQKQLASTLQNEAMRERLAELPARINTLAMKTTDLASRKMIEPMLASLRERLRQPRIGIMVDPRPRDTDKWGAYVTSVTPGSPADKAGILSGDIIMRVAGKSVTEGGEKNEDSDASSPSVRLINLVSQLEPGKPVSLELRRGTQNRTVRVTPIEDDSPAIARLTMPMSGSMAFTMPGRELTTYATPEPFAITETPSMNIFPGNGASSFFYSFGSNGLFANLELVSLNEKLGSYFGTGEGVLVVSTEARRPFTVAAAARAGSRLSSDSGVARGTPRARVTVRGDDRDTTYYLDGNQMRRTPIDIGLEPGDVIVSVDGRKVTTPSQLMRIVGTYDRGDEFKLQIMRQKRAESLNVKMP